MFCIDFATKWSSPSILLQQVDGLSLSLRRSVQSFGRGSDFSHYSSTSKGALLSPAANRKPPQAGWGPRTDTPDSAHPSGNSFHQNLYEASEKAKRWTGNIRTFSADVKTNSLSPTLALRNLFPILWSMPIALATSSTSAPVASHRALMLLMLLIRCARNALAACTQTHRNTHLALW